MKKNKYFYGEHFEHLGYLWDGIYGKAENFTEEQFDNTIKKSTYYFDKTYGKTSYGAFLYEDNRYFSILHYFKRIKEDTYYVSSCPILAGAKNKLILKKRHTWHNNIEGVFAAKSTTCNELLLNFYDPFYALDKEKYNHNTRKNVYLSAVALNTLELKEEDHVFTEGSFYEHYLEEFLKENPNKTKDDFEPVIVQMRSEHFRMCMGKDTTCVYEIVGLIEDVKYTKILGKKTAVLKVNLEHREDKEFLYVNVYVAEHLLKKYKPKKNKAIVAVIWLNGYFDDNIETRELSLLAKFGISFLVFIVLNIYHYVFDSNTFKSKPKPKPPQIEYRQEHIDFKRIK